ncbi:MAG: AzlD domain-containing protein [Candidatus Rokubacteria bacterium]|nr:AzlD domain-containing protein [Candidatus Rokubacteria bacterium]
MPVNLLALVATTAVVTFALRYVPVTVLHRRELPGPLQRVLGNLPLAILSALICQWTFLRDGHLDWGVSNFYLFGFLGAILLSVLTRNLAASVFGSVGIVAALTVLFGPR